MLKKTITYTDYNGNVRTEDFYFNLTKAEINEMNLSTTGGLEQMIHEISSTMNVPKIAAVFKDLILRAYGVKSPDGRRFIKSKALSEEFSQTEAYSELYMELLQDETGATANAFIEGVLPKDIRSDAKPATV